MAAGKSQGVKVMTRPHERAFVLSPSRAVAMHMCIISFKVFSFLLQGFLRCSLPNSLDVSRTMEGGIRCNAGALVPS